MDTSQHKAAPVQRIAQDSTLSAYKRPVQVLVYPVRRTESGWRYLMLHRIPARGGFWQGVTGGAEWGEELLDAASRELWEETRLRAIELRALGCSYAYPMQDRWKDFYHADTEEIEEHAFLAIVEGVKVTISSEEHDEWRWSTYDEALDLLKRREAVQALQCCQRALSAEARSS
jgi:8-oxo-dGTP pyrophosphatase MutT (NUDIX family)